MTSVRELQVVTDRGTASVRLPQRIRWQDGHATLFPRVQQRIAVEQVLLEQFHTAVTEGRTVDPNLARGYRLLSWWRLGLRSLEESRWIEVPAEKF